MVLLVVPLDNRQIRGGRVQLLPNGGVPAKRELLACHPANRFVTLALRTAGQTAATVAGRSAAPAQFATEHDMDAEAMMSVSCWVLCRFGARSFVAWIERRWLE